MNDSTDRHTESPFAEPQFRWLYVSNLFFFLAMGGQGVLKAWLVFEITDSEFALGLVAAFGALPMLLAAPLGGVIADRLDRRSLILVGQASVLVIELALLVLILTDALVFWHLLTATVLSAIVYPFMMPARGALIANVVGVNRLTQAMAMNNVGMNATRIVGPAAAGFLIGAIGIGGAYGLSVGCYGMALLCLFPVHATPPAPDAKDRSIGRSILDGFGFMRDERIIMMLLIFGLVPIFLGMPLQNLLVVFSEEIWQRGPTGFGMLAAAAGLGGLAGTLLIAARPNPRRRGLLMLLSALAFCVFLMLFSWSPWFEAALVILFAANFFASILGTLNSTAIQVLIPDNMRGRVSSILMMSFTLPMLGSLPIGALAEFFGAPIAVSASGGLAFLIAIGLFAASPELRSLDRRLRSALD